MTDIYQSTFKTFFDNRKKQSKKDIFNYAGSYKNDRFHLEPGISKASNLFETELVS